ncbi:MAG TPA: hypothetical protein VN317_05450, partial [Candidatus Methanoperedens sp.]|nr:hypothetical protein [Candidatus Methanoperedens sp.]
MREAGRARPAAHRSLGALCALALWAAGCATREPSLLDAGELDRQHDRICRTIAEVVDAADKAFGEPRVEDRERIVRAKVGIKSTLREREPAAWSVPHNLRLPLPALERQVNFFLDLTADTDTENFSHPRAAASEGD